MEQPTVVIDKRNMKVGWHFHRWQWRKLEDKGIEVVTLYPHGKEEDWTPGHNEICIICGKTRYRYHDPK